MLLIVMAFSMPVLKAQTTFVIENVPESTPEGDAFFLSGGFNGWNASDVNYRFTKGSNGKYYLSPKMFNNPMISFLVTRGSWETVEAEKEGIPTLTRKLSRKNSKDTVSLDIKGWADKEGMLNTARKITIKLIKIPESTPPDVPIYTTGNFNGWVPGDKRYKLIKSDDGTYAVDVPTYWPSLEYKFTRGNWHTVEGKAYGRPRSDRIVVVDSSSYSQPVVSSVSYWEDQSSGLFNPYTLILILTAIQGIILILIISSYENNNKRANRTLGLLIFLISFALLTRVAIYDRDVYGAYPRLSLLPDIVYFLYAPLFLIYIRRLLNASKNSYSQVWSFFVPFVLQVVFYIVYFSEPIHLFIDRGLNTLYSSTIYIAIGGLALLFNLWYWFKIRSIIKAYLKNVEETYSGDQNVIYLKNILFLKAICLALWLVTYLVGGIGLAIGYNLSAVTSVLVDTTWVVFSFTVYLLGYFAIKQPAIFKIHDEVAHEVPKPTLNEEEIVHLKKELTTVMESEKVYLNPSLNLPELAHRINSNVHMLSRTINEGFDKNFRDFVNYYRVMDFIDRAKQEGYKNHTFLGIALDVGFNSKSSFNRSFKKITGKSPRDYFNNPD